MGISRSRPQAATIMNVMERYEKIVDAIAHSINRIAAASIMVMMLLTTADVVLRYFRHPITGAYEIVGFLGSIAVGFALAYTSVQKGHIAVSFLFQRLTQRSQAFIDTVNALVALCFFSLLTWQCMVLGKDLMRTGEVSLTLEMPFYPFVFGLAVGCAMLCLVLATDLLRSLNKLFKK
jgi:TRAP-type C4-dicarboxylate transport system permease small subunit